MQAVTSGSNPPLLSGRHHWSVLALCLALAACQAPPTEDVAVAAPIRSAEPAPAPVDAPDAVATVEPEEEAPEEALDDSYTRANLRPSYGQCVKASQANTAALEVCGDEEFAYHDARLKQAVAAMVASPDSKAKDQWMDEQAAWVDDTDQHCTWDPNTEGQGQMLDAQSCRINRTANRADALQALTPRK